VTHRGDGLLQISVEGTSHPSSHGHHKHPFRQKGPVTLLQGLQLGGVDVQALRQVVG
jgi:hypothetical protein